MEDGVGAAGAINAVGGEEKPALGERMPGEMDKRHHPGKACQLRLAMAAEHQRCPQHGNRNGGILGAGKTQQPAPVLLLEGIERGEDGAGDGDGHDENADTRCGRGIARRRPIKQTAAQGMERRVENHAGQDGPRCSAAGAVGGGEPLIERQEAELGAEADHQQHGDEDTQGKRYRRRRRLEGGKAERAAGRRQQHKRRQKRHGACFQQPQHEQNRPPGVGLELFRKDHRRAAKTHDLPGDEQPRAIAEAEHTERADEACRHTEQPARLARAHRRRQPASHERRHQSETHQPQCIAREPERHVFTRQPAGQGDGRGAAGQGQ